MPCRVHATMIRSAARNGRQGDSAAHPQGSLASKNRSISLRDEALGRLPGPGVARVRLAWRQFDLDRPHFLIGNLPQQMPDAVETGTSLVVGIDDVPRRLLA